MRIRHLNRRGTGTLRPGHTRTTMSAAGDILVVSAGSIAVGYFTDTSVSHALITLGLIGLAITAVIAFRLTWLGWSIARCSTPLEAEFRLANSPAAVASARRAGITAERYAWWKQRFPDMSLWLLTNMVKNGVTAEYAEAVLAARWQTRPTLRVVLHAHQAGVSTDTLSLWSANLHVPLTEAALPAMASGMPPEEWGWWHDTFFQQRSAFSGVNAARVGLRLVEHKVPRAVVERGLARHPYGIDLYCGMVERLDIILQNITPMVKGRDSLRLAAEWACAAVTRPSLCRTPFHPNRSDITPWHEEFEQAAPLLAGHFRSPRAALNALADDPNVVDRLRMLDTLTA